MEQKVKQALGEYQFLILALNVQIEKLQEEIKKLNEDKPERKKTN